MTTRSRIEGTVGSVLRLVVSAAMLLAAVLGAAVPVDDLVAAATDSDGFQAHLNASLKERLASRLTEMQSETYRQKPHMS